MVVQLSYPGISLVWNFVATYEFSNAVRFPRSFGIEMARSTCSFGSVLKSKTHPFGQPGSSSVGVVSFGCTGPVQKPFPLLPMTSLWGQAMIEFDESGITVLGEAAPEETTGQTLMPSMAGSFEAAAFLSAGSTPARARKLHANRRHG